MDLLNKTAVVTGASDGIGKQVAIRLAAAGVNLALIGRDRKRLSATKSEAEKRSAKIKVRIYPCDIRSGADLTRTVRKISLDFKQVHILLNIAGIWQKMMPIEEVPELVIEDVIQTNLTALIRCTRLVLPLLKRQKEAAIINISSKSGVTAQAGQSVYSASKWGVRGFTEVLKTDLKDSRVRVSGIYQSGTNTGMFNKTEEIVPVEKFTDPADLAEVIVFALSRPERIWLHEVRVEY